MNKNEQAEITFKSLNPKSNITLIEERQEKDLHKDIKRLASSMEKLVKLLTKVIKENS
jgi:hypothetical protein|tara:strand:+ start:938 stop:1111 length:174 start_codon:yes stop_codon:yes gene_type:complete